MRLGVDLSESITAWNAYIDKLGKDKSRYLCDALEEEFWDQYYAQGPIDQEAYAKEVIQAMADIRGDLTMDTALELGPGWGNYTFYLAETVGSLQVLDLSEAALKRLANKAEELGHNNISYHMGYFDAFDFESYDMIVGFNCFYRQKDIDQLLEKISRSAQKLVVLGMTTSYEARFNKEISEQLGLPLDGMGNDYIQLTNILYAQGIDVNQRLVPISRSYYFEDLLAVKKHECFRIKEGYESEAVDRILEKHLEKEAGGYRLDLDAYVALVYWYPEVHKTRRLL